jgi:hypothetical protein
MSAKKNYECGDCGRKFGTAAEFSDHVHVCTVNPVPGSPVVEADSKQ